MMIGITCTCIYIVVYCTLGIRTSAMLPHVLYTTLLDTYYNYIKMDNQLVAIQFYISVGAWLWLRSVYKLCV